MSQFLFTHHCLPAGGSAESIESLVDIAGNSASTKWTAPEEFEFSMNESGDERSLSNVSCNSSTTGEQGSTEEYTPGTFEGPEKTMEVVFKTSSKGKQSDIDDDAKKSNIGLRAFSREQLDRICRKAKCTIMSKCSNQHMDSYVLSESSLFIYEQRLIMKTCGTTTLLRCLPVILEYADEIGLDMAWLGYSRKNFLFPSAQMWPHANFGDEMRYINTHEKLQKRLGGEGYILGPVTGDHWFVYIAENLKQRILEVAPSSTVAMLPNASTTNISDTPAIFDYESSNPPILHDHHAAMYFKQHHMHYRTMNMMMFDMARETSSIFHGADNGLTAKEMTAKAGIQALCPGALIDEQSFNPCGYSMNAILHDAYSTIHIAPEEDCSYVSFETNTRLTTYDPLVRQVLSVFRPKRFVLTMFGDDLFLKSLRAVPTDKLCINLPAHQGLYKRTSVSSTMIEQQKQCCIMACYTFYPTSISSCTLQTAAAETESIAAAATASLVEQQNDFPALTSELPPHRRERAYSCL